MKSNVAEVGSLEKLVFNSILFLGLSSLLPGNVLIGSLPVPFVTLLFPREPGITFTVLHTVLFDHGFSSLLLFPVSVAVREGEKLPNQLGGS